MMTRAAIAMLFLAGATLACTPADDDELQSHVEPERTEVAVPATPGYDDGLVAYRNGELQEARRIWTALAEAGNPRAMYALGKLYDSGGPGLDAEPDSAASWYQAAADAGIAAADNDLARLYVSGRGVARDEARAASLWRDAAERGNAEAQFNYALALYEGVGVQRNLAQAVQWFRRAAENGSAEAQFAVAEFYRLGVGLEQNPAMALAWYEQAAAAGHQGADAQAAIMGSEGIEPAELALPTATPAASAAGDDPAPASVVQTAETAEAEAAQGPAAEAARSTPSATTGSPNVQPLYAIWLGSLPTREQAERHWAELRQSFPDHLVETDVTYLGVQADGRTFQRVLAGDFPSAEAAQDACSALTAQAPRQFCRVHPL